MHRRPFSFLQTSESIASVPGWSGWFCPRPFQQHCMGAFAIVAAGQTFAGAQSQGRMQAYALACRACEARFSKILCRALNALLCTDALDPERAAGWGGNCGGRFLRIDQYGFVDDMLEPATVDPGRQANRDQGDTDQGQVDQPRFPHRSFSPFGLGPRGRTREREANGGGSLLHRSRGGGPLGVSRACRKLQNLRSRSRALRRA